MSDLFPQLPNCPSWCEGHADESTPTHHGTELDYFGTDGPVVVTQVDGHEPVVALVDLERPAAEFTPNEARMLAYQILTAADFAERAGREDMTSIVAKAVAAALADQAVIHGLAERRPAGLAVAA